MPLRRPGCGYWRTATPRVPMVVISESGDWREVQLAVTRTGCCWVRAADLAFGADTENVVCTFPTHEEVDRAQEAVSSSARRFPWR